MLTVGNIVPRAPRRRGGGGIRRAFDKRYRSVLTRAYDFENREFDLDRLNGIIRVDEGSAELNEYRDRLLKERVLAALDCELGGETAMLWLELGSASHAAGHPEMLQVAREFRDSLEKPFMAPDKFGNLVDTRGEELKVCHVYELHRYLSRLVKQLWYLAKAHRTPAARRKPSMAAIARYFLRVRSASPSRAPRSQRRASFSVAASSPGGGDSSGDPDSGESDQGDPPGPYPFRTFVTPPSNRKNNQEPSRPWLSLGCCCMERGRPAW